MFLQSLLFALNLVSHGAPGGGQSISTSPPPIIKLAKDRPNPPPKPPPNQGKPGGGLNTAKQSCRNSTESLTALVPVQNPVLTTTGRPTLLFYVADAPADIRQGKFMIFTQDDKTRIYETQFTLPQAPGIISIRLPESSKAALEVGQSYHWYFKLYCQGSKSAAADLDINGWIQRVAATPDRQRLIEAGQPDIWYDALANLAQRLQANPQDPVLKERWRTLLKSIEMEHLATKPLLSTVAAGTP
jgi:Domain of Unknown Function (DUF928)